MDVFYVVRGGEVEALYGDGWIAEALENDYLLFDSPEEALESVDDEHDG